MGSGKVSFGVGMGVAQGPIRCSLLGVAYLRARQPVDLARGRACLGRAGPSGSRARGTLRRALRVSPRASPRGGPGGTPRGNLRVSPRGSLSGSPRGRLVGAALRVLGPGSALARVVLHLVRGKGRVRVGIRVRVKRVVLHLVRVRVRVGVRVRVWFRFRLERVVLHHVDRIALR